MPLFVSQGFDRIKLIARDNPKINPTAADTLSAEREIDVSILEQLTGKEGGEKSKRQISQIKIEKRVKLQLSTFDF
jgi:hypothetical protein